MAAPSTPATPPPAGGQGSGRQKCDVESAGAVVFAPGRRVLLVHRGRYDDWSFPKGKLDPGEHRTAAAVREVEEETGLHVRLGVPLTGQRYPIERGMKKVHYWVARPVGVADVSGYLPNEEIDAVEWVDAAEAPARLTYPYDRVTLAEAWGMRRRTRTLVVLRHGKARSRRAWRPEDRLRPLLAVGHEAAQRIVPLLAAYDVCRLVSSTSTRCVQTLEPYAAVSDHPMQLESHLAEEGATPSSVARVVDDVLAGLVEPTPGPGEGGVVLCSHRPVLPWVFERLGVADPGLEPGEMCVLHLRRGRVLATERHLTH